VIKARLGQDLDAVVYRIFPFVRELTVSPDVLTLAGAGVSFLAAWAFALDKSFLAGLLIVAAGATWTAVQRILEGRRLLRELEATGVDPTRAEDDHGE